METMNTGTVLEFVNQRPFEPFVVRLSNGEKYEVRHPENIMVLKTRLVIGYPEDDRVVQVGLIHVNSIENLQTA